jgi:hypothetical protein
VILYNFKRSNFTRELNTNETRDTPLGMSLEKLN